MAEALSSGARALLDRAFEDIDVLADYHVHAVSQEVNPTWRSWLHPIRRARTMVYWSAAGVDPGPSAVADYEARLLDLVRHIPAPVRIYIMALDRFHHEDGRADLEKTPIHVPNEHVMALAERYPRTFVPVVSVHPYRDDAIAALERWASRGCRHVKWLPNSMNIDPSSERTEPFYRKMAELDMVLLTHTGDERAFEAHGLQHLGNPLLLRRPLDMGVRTVALHSASDGEAADLESPRREEVPAFDLLLRLLEEPRYEGLIFGEISGVTFFNHLGRPLEVLLERQDLHHRFVNGSDYPFSALNTVIRTSQLARAGFITAEERVWLNEIYDFNPLLFDFAVKRTVRHPLTGARLSAAVFEVPPGLR